MTAIRSFSANQKRRDETFRRLSTGKRQTELLATIGIHSTTSKLLTELSNAAFISRTLPTIESHEFIRNGTVYEEYEWK